MHCTGRVESPEQVLVKWPGAPLTSRERVTVRVRVWTPDTPGPSAWSEPATIEAGLLDPADWQAMPVGAGWDEDPQADRRPARVRKDFRLDRPVERARLYVTAHGLYEVEINGRRVGDEALAPGWTVYPHRLRYRTHDVTGHLTDGANTIGAWLGDGWYRGRYGFDGGTRNIYGTDQSLIAQLEITYADGATRVIATDPTWTAARGPILSSGLYEGRRSTPACTIPAGPRRRRQARSGPLSASTPATRAPSSHRRARRCAAPRSSPRSRSPARTTAATCSTSGRTSSAGSASPPTVPQAPW